MERAHLKALLTAAEARGTDEGWSELPDGKSLTLYAAHQGVALTIMRVKALREDGDLLLAQTAKGETFILNTADTFAGAVEGATLSSRKAGFF